MATAARTDLMDTLHGGLIVSCQARPGVPLHGPEHMSEMARAAAQGGAVGIRAEGPADVRAVRAAVDLPLVGLWKVGDSGVYITPAVEHATAVADAGADIVAADATARPRPGSDTFADIVRAVHDRGLLVMADIATLAEGIQAEADGADMVGTTLSGYTGGPVPDGPDLDLVARLAAELSIPVIAEGRIHTPEEAADSLARGAWAVTVGTAITAPGWITGRFVGALGR